MEPSQLFTGILLTPLVSAAIIALFLRRGGFVAAGVSVAAAGVILLLSGIFLVSWDGEALPAMATNWITLGDFEINMGFLINAETATMLMVVSFVGFLIHVFSVGYMDDDANKGRFFGGLSIFMFSMLGIVLADNLIMIFVFWELVGFSSYMLIAHYWDKGFAADASKKAFIVNRVGDFGFLLGIVLTYWQFGTTNLVELKALAEANPELVTTQIGVFLMCGFLGKSAQFPLHVWLTDAMAGPTPVSALIHAATMVAAGIYFMVRVFFLLTPETQEVIMWLSVVMTAFAGVCALGQTDIKKTLAYSTLSHLGFMGAALGLGYPSLALLHMVMHAFFKATLFLCSGSVIHACHHEQDMFKMGGLFGKMKFTAIPFIMATLAIVAFPYTSGFFSKDTIISGAWARAIETGDSSYYVVYALLLFAALTTALYMGRMVWVVFFGKPNSKNAEHAHEGSWFMRIPLVILGIYSLGAGMFLIGDGGMSLLPKVATLSLTADFHEIAEVVHDAHYGLLAAGIAVMLVGLGGTFFFYGLGPSEDRLQKNFGPVYSVLNKHGWFDDVYDWYVANVQQRIADVIGFLDLLLVSGLMVRGTAGLVGLFGMVGRSMHTGSIHGYIYWFLTGVVILGAFALGLL